MIFVTVGTDHHPFPRVFEWIAKAREDSSIDPSEPIVAQYGHTRVALPADCEGKQFLPFDEMLDNFRKAQVVEHFIERQELLSVPVGRQFDLGVPVLGDDLLGLVDDSVLSRPRDPLEHAGKGMVVCAYGYEDHGSRPINVASL